jgi:hypothetical protein
MPSFDRKRANDLSSFAKTRLGRSLSEQEEALIAQATSSTDFIGPINHIRTAIVEADFVRWLASDAAASAYLDPKGIRLLSTSVRGNLDLDNCRLTTSLIFRSCTFAGEIRLDTTIVKNLEFRDCTFQGAIKGGSTQVDGSIYFRDSVALDEITLERARITGDLSFAGLDVQNPSASIVLDGASVTGSVVLTDGFKTASSVQMHLAKVGSLDCSGAIFTDLKAIFSLDGITVNGDPSSFDTLKKRGRIPLRHNPRHTCVPTLSRNDSICLRRMEPTSGVEPLTY